MPFSHNKPDHNHNTISHNQLYNRLRLYAVTDRSKTQTYTLEEQVTFAIEGGITMLQLREKHLSTAEFIKLAETIKVITDKYAIPLIINDNIDVAKAVDADGLHIGQDDIAPEYARSAIGTEKILGVSAQTVEQARAAEQAGADYLGVGTIFPTGSKPDAQRVSLATLKDICTTSQIPVVAIGGLDEQTIPLLQGSGIQGVAVISAIFAKTDIRAAAQNLLKLTDTIID